MTSSFENSRGRTFDARRWKVPAAIALLVFVAAAPVMHSRGEQQASRYALTAAVWDNQTVELGEFAFMLGRDRAVRDGVTYSDKAPGQPFLAVPFYGIYRIAGGDAARLASGDVSFGLWWVTVWTAAVPAAVLAVLMFCWARDIEPKKALPATLTLAFGTLLFVYSTLLFGHVLSAAMAFGMFMLIRRRSRGLWALAGAGLLGGAAVLVEYPVALIVGVLVVAAFVRHGARVWAVIAGGAPAAALLATYNWRVNGSPLVLSYQWTGFSGPLGQEGQVFDIFRGPQLERFTHVLFSERGLFLATPVLSIALIGLVLLWRRGRRFEAIVAGSAFLVMLAIQISWANSYAGGAGPRYITPGIPFLAAPLAVAWSRWRRTTMVLAVISLLTMVTATLTVPQLASAFDGGLGYWLVLAGNGEFAPILPVVLLGGWGWVVYGVAVASALAWLVRTAQADRELSDRQTLARLLKSAAMTSDPESMHADG